MVDVRALVLEIGVLGGDVKAVGEARGNPQHAVVFRAQRDPVPLTQGGGVAAQVNDDIEDLAGGDPHQFALGVLGLVVHAAQDAPAERL